MNQAFLTDDEIEAMQLRERRILARRNKPSGTVYCTLMNSTVLSCEACKKKDEILIRHDGRWNRYTCISAVAAERFKYEMNDSKRNIGLTFTNNYLIEARELERKEPDNEKNACGTSVAMDAFAEAKTVESMGVDSEEVKQDREELTTESAVGECYNG